MKHLVRLYPQAWRERYGEELEALLAERPPSPADVVDLMLGALDAHLRQRRIGYGSERRTALATSLRLGGWAAAVGGGLWILFFGIAGASYATNADYGAAWIPVALIGGLTLLAALASFSAFEAKDHSRLIWFAFVVPAIGVALLCIGLAVALAADGGAASSGSLAVRFIYGGLTLMLIGSVVFASVTISTAAFSRVAAGAIGVGVIAALPGLFGVTAALWLVIGGLVFGLGWIGLGIDAIRRDRLRGPTHPVAA